jgi:hypothetical protein
VQGVVSSNPTVPTKKSTRVTDFSVARFALLRDTCFTLEVFLEVLFHSVVSAKSLL